MNVKRIFPFLIFFSALTLPLSQLYGADIKVVLTGNTGDAKSSELLFSAIENYCSKNDSPIFWVLNGDLFPSAWNENEISRWQERMNAVLDRHAQLQVIVNQGDMDWDRSGEKGWEKIKLLDEILDKNKHPRFHSFLKQGCPGPWTFSTTGSMTFVVINSQWWNHPFEKPNPTDDACSIADTDIFIEELEGILDESETRNIMILSHFPLRSLGNYGGRFPASSYLLPPLVGSAWVGFRQNVGTSKDINNSRFDEFRYKLNGVLQNYSSLVFASGHEQNQSIIRAGANYFVNSGAPFRGSYSASDPNAILSTSAPGFIEITYRDNGEVLYNHVVTDGVNTRASGVLLKSFGRTSNDNESTGAIPLGDSTSKVAGASKGVTVAIAGSEYASRKFKEQWLGRHYRKSWTVPVKVSYLDMDTTFGGLVVKGKGGGRQTTSLKLSGGNGKEYVFRSVNKDPSKALGYELRGTIVSEVLKDQTTTQQPYGALAVASLMDKIDLLHATPELYVLPDDERLGSFRQEHVNLFGMLEERPNDKIEKEKVFAGADNINKSFQLFSKIYRDHDNTIQSKEFARARIFDLWIGDWSKHEDNWKWAGYKKEDGKTFRPIPRDRDHAFSRWDGIIPWLADREWGMPNGENFDYKIKGLRSLMWQARHLDRFISSELSREDWVNAANQIQSSINEKDISTAIHKMPSEIYEADGAEIEKKLDTRLKDLHIYAGRYYNILATEVDVVGSHKQEYFHAIRRSDGSVDVSVYNLSKKEPQPRSSNIRYHRVFYKNETKEIRLFGLRGSDVFLIEGESARSILIRIISGEGLDSVTDRSHIRGHVKKTLIYDQGPGENISLGSEAKKVSNVPSNYYDYDRSNFKYNTYLPVALVTYNSFTGLALQTGVSFTRHRFGKPDFSAKYRINGSASVQGNYEVNVGAQFRHVLGKWDGVSEVLISRPLNFNYFFGIGNDTKMDQEVSNDYYRAQYNMASISVGLTRDFWKRSKLSFVANYEIDRGVTRSNSYLGDHPEVFGVDQLHLFFLKSSLDLDFRDRQALPEHGFRLVLDQAVGDVQHSDHDFASISRFEIENYLSTYNQNPITLGLRLGGGTTSGELPFYKLFSLGQMNDLHGFKRNRFTGQSKAFLNTELRVQLTETNNTFIPLKIGVRGFYDIGRVWADTDNADADYWHYGYGAGFYVTPFQERFSFNFSAGRSNEESLLLMVSIGAFFR